MQVFAFNCEHMVYLPTRLLTASHDQLLLCASSLYSRQHTPAPANPFATEPTVETEISGEPDKYLRLEGKGPGGEHLGRILGEGTSGQVGAS